MITTDFAPNETWSDALLSLKLLMQPWKWYQGQATMKVTSYLKRLMPHTGIRLHLSGRAALYRLMRDQKLPQGSEVAVTGFTCEAVVLPVMAAKLAPLYIDIEKDTLSMDADVLRRRITPQTKIVILQHTFGLVPRDRDRVLQLAKEYNLLVIEDLAHGFNPSDSQMLAPSARTAILLSFGRSKALSSVFGGALMTNNQTLFKFDNTNTLPDIRPHLLIRLLLYKPFAICIKAGYAFGLGKLLHGILKRLGLLVAEISQTEKMGTYDPFLDAAYPNSLAVLLLEQIRRFDLSMKRRLFNSDYYRMNLKVRCADQKWFDDGVPFIRFPVRVFDRDRLVAYCRKKGVFLGTWYTQPVAPYPLPLPAVMYIIGTCPVGEAVCREIINLPTLVSNRDAKTVVDVINSYYHPQ